MHRKIKHAMFTYRKGGLESAMEKAVSEANHGEALGLTLIGFQNFPEERIIVLLFASSSATLSESQLVGE